MVPRYLDLFGISNLKSIVFGTLLSKRGKAWCEAGVSGLNGILWLPESGKMAALVHACARDESN
jgi:hypothetical protein